ncbi:MAG: hypothetical protein R2788_00780 [Saprospiraceae bacterium]
MYYSWEPTTGLSCADCPDPLAAPDETTTYVLTAWDSYGCEVYDTITIVVNEVLEAIGGQFVFQFPEIALILSGVK